MTPKEKAVELFRKMNNVEEPMGSYPMCFESAKQCALIAVDEIDNAIDFDWMEVQNLESQHRYWQEVKKEIEAL